MRPHSLPPRRRKQAQQTRPPDPPASEEWVDAAWVAAQLGVSRTTIANWAEAGLMPPPLRVLGSRYVRWRRRVILAWLAEQEARASGGCAHAS